MADISIRRVAKNYGKVKVVHELDLEIASGEFVVILGPSGCGKSTLLRMIAGLEDITAGEIAIDGEVVNKKEPRERGCAMVFQNYALYPHLSVADNMGYALKVAGVPKDKRNERVAVVADTLGLTPFLDRRPAQLSGGQRQRVAMGRAMIREPKVFLFDEPLSNLDAELRVRMRIEIRKLHNRLATTSVFVTHDQVEAMTLADRMVVLNQGRVEQIGTPTEVYHRPATRFVASFIGAPAMNLLDGRVGPDRSIVFDDGGRLVAPELSLAEGTPITLGVRPEDVVLGAAAVGDAAAWHLAVEFVEHLGASSLVHGRFAGRDFVAASTERDPKGGESRLPIAIPPEAIHVFDAGTGRRVDA